MAFGLRRPRIADLSLCQESSPRIRGLQHLNAVAAAIVLALVGLVATPYANVPLIAIPGYMTAFGTAMIVINLILAAILFSRSAVEQRRDVSALGTAYLYVAVINVPLVASFPDALMSGSLIGGGISAIWLWLFWHGGFGIAILRYAAIAAQPQRPGPSIIMAGLTVLAVVAAMTVTATTLLPYLPATFENGHALFSGVAGLMPLLVLAILGLGTVQVGRLGARTPEQVWLTVAMIAACFDVWLTYCGVNRYSLGWYLAKCGSLSTSLIVMITLLHQINLLYSRVAMANETLRGLAGRDGLTGLINRRGLDEMLAIEWRKSRRDMQQLSLLMVDVDHFKRFNDRYGHPGGDQCLRKVAAALLSVVRRPADIVARYGGEEFALLLPNTDAAGAEEMARRMQAAIRAMALPHPDSQHGIVTVSMGVATMLAGDAADFATLVSKADRALYRAKAAGRDTFNHADDTQGSGAPSLPARHGMVEASDVQEATLTVTFSPRRDQSKTWRQRRSLAAPGALGELQSELLEAIADGRPLQTVATWLCEGVEQLSPGIVCSLLLVDEAKLLRPLASPQLPERYVRALDGLPIGPTVGSCGTAAYYAEPVVCTDIATDPCWVLYKDQLLAAGLQACWSTPIKRDDGLVLAVLAFYARTPRGPTANEHMIAAAIVPICAMAIERCERWSQLQEANQRLDATVSNLTQGVCLFSKGRLVFSNQRYSEIYNLDPRHVRPGITLQQMVALRIAVGSGPKMPAADYRAWLEQVQNSRKASETVVELQNGRAIAIRHRPMPNDEWVSTHDDITERRLTDQALLYATQHDVLTGLPNRALFQERVQQALALLGRGQGCSVICLNIDQFKPVNDIFGHDVGDRLLQIASDRLQACVREVDVVARFSGTEFAVLLLGLDQPERTAALVHRIITTLSEPFDIDGRSISVGATAGIAIAPNDGAIPGKLLQSADTALYRAKQDARGSYRYFEPEMDTRMQARFALEADLRRAVRDCQFEIAYQPLLNLAANMVSGFEALVRWRHPTRGLVSPVEFIPIMEETGLIVPMGEWVLMHACVEAASWSDPVKLAVNLSAVQFKRPGLVATVERALQSSGLAAARLELEITESVLLREGANTLETLHALRALGVRIAMDDFGTGYSSLSYLRSFPFDKIKIDQSFIRDVPKRSESMAIIHAIAGLGRSMGMETTAEGVETPEQLDYVRREGCTEIQGYLLSRPIAADAIPALLRAPQDAFAITTYPHGIVAGVQDGNAGRSSLPAPPARPAARNLRIV